MAICKGNSTLLGSNDQSLGWDIINNKCLYNDCVINAYPAIKPQSYKVGDTIVVILNLKKGTLSFYDGNEKLGQCMSGLRLFARRDQMLYPAVSVSHPGAVIGIRYLGTNEQNIGKTCYVTTCKILRLCYVAYFISALFNTHTDSYLFK